MIIYGAGLAGLLAAQMLRRFQPVVYEAKSSLPNNHSALLRFRSDVVSHAVGIPFREVQVYKSVKFDGKVQARLTLQMANLYSYKVTGQLMARSVMSLEPVQRYIAPFDLISQMAKNVTIRYGEVIQSREQIAAHAKQNGVIISTVPMSAMVKILEWPVEELQFSSNGIWTVTATISAPFVCLYQTLYYPELESPYYRASITDNIVIIEHMQLVDSQEMAQKHISQVLQDFGLAYVRTESVQIHYQQYGKLIPVVDDRARRAFIFGLTQQYQMYSLGRFATWRQLLLDDVVNDVKMIESLIVSRETYDQHLAFAKRG